VDSLLKKVLDRMPLWPQEVDFTPLAMVVGSAVDSAPGPDPPRPKRTHHVDDEARN
jgi:hypothetical protein